MSNSDSETDFSYDGYLVFNGIYSTNVLNPGFDLEEIIDGELKDFERGSIEKPANGYKTIPFAKYVVESSSINKVFEDCVSDVEAIRHEYEEWERKEVDLGEKAETKPVRDTDSVDAYWSFPQFMFIKGNKTQAKRAGELLELKLNDHLKIREIEFTSDFLLWVLSKYKNSEWLNSNLKASILTDAEIEGDEDRFGQRNRVDRSTDIAKSTPVLMGVL